MLSTAWVAFKLQFVNFTTGSECNKHHAAFEVLGL